MMRQLITLVHERRVTIALILALALFIANIIAQPGFAAASQIAPTLGTFAPFALAAMASTPAFLSGGGGIDLSIAPLMGLINIVFVTRLLGTGLGSPAVAVPLLLALGAAAGAVNGVLIALLRYPPVIATLGSFFVLSGLDLFLVPDPVTAPRNWTNSLAQSVGPIPGALISIGIPLLCWLLLRRTAFVDSLLAVGDHDATAFSSGVRVSAVRIAAYTGGGLIAAIGGIALTGLIQSADATVFNGYVLVALSAVALGGTNLGGGRGGLFSSMIGAVSVFLIQNLLTSLHASAYAVQIAYGGMLLLAVMFGARFFNRPPANA